MMCYAGLEATQGEDGLDPTFSNCSQVGEAYSRVSAKRGTEGMASVVFL